MGMLYKPDSCLRDNSLVRPDTGSGPGGGWQRTATRRSYCIRPLRSVPGGASGRSLGRGAGRSSPFNGLAPTIRHG